MTQQAKKIRVGIIGVGRGQSFARGATDTVGMELVAICDQWEEKLNEVGKQYGVTTYTDYDKFLEHDMGAVILANYFNEHAPFAIKALKAGKHVMSETAANKTLAEGVALCQAVEETGKIYMFAENYPPMQRKPLDQPIGKANVSVCQMALLPSTQFCATTPLKISVAQNGIISLSPSFFRTTHSPIAPPLQSLAYGGSWMQQLACGFG